MNYFEGCLPIEETARRGRDTLRFGPMKPAGLTNPKTGRWPYARRPTPPRKSSRRQLQPSRLPEPPQIRRASPRPRMIPGLEHATFLRYGQIHRNTYIHAPSLLTETPATSRPSQHPDAGQLSGVEGYTESIASGLSPVATPPR